MPVQIKESSIEGRIPVYLCYPGQNGIQSAHIESPEAKETLALGDWTGYRIFLDGDGDITGRIVSEQEIEQVRQAREFNPFPYSVGELNEVKRLPYLVGESFCIDPDDLPEGAVIDNGILQSPLRDEDPDSGPGPA